MSFKWDNTRNVLVSGNLRIRRGVGNSERVCADQIITFDDLVPCMLSEIGDIIPKLGVVFTPACVSVFLTHLVIVSL